MGGYATRARIDAPRVHVVRSPLVSGESTPLDRQPRGELIDLQPAPSLGERATAFVERVREQWAITTFYLFDPESWR